MKRFVSLFHDLGNTTKLNRKIALMAEYFSSVRGADRDLALFILAGGNLKRQVNTTELRRWATEYSDVPEWLFEESYHVVGDLAETISLLCRCTVDEDPGSLSDWVKYLESLKGKGEEDRKRAIFDAWSVMSQRGIIVFNKLMTAALRIGVSKAMVIKAVATATGIPEAEISLRLSGRLTREGTSYDALLEENRNADSLTPYPFYLAYALEGEPDALGERSEWLVEWKWDGIRGQLVIREGGYAVWSRGEELLTDNFPEFREIAAVVPTGTVIDGEIIGWAGNGPLPFSALQRRITRKNAGAKVMQECPLVFLSYDLLEKDGSDIRAMPLGERRRELERIVADAGSPRLRISEVIQASSWRELSDFRSRSRSRRAEGLMLKRLSSSYQVGRRRGDWWKWKVDPFTIDGVLIYAQKGHGRRADLYTDYTFGVWDNGALVPFAKAYSGLTDGEFRRVDAFIKKNTTERFGPVRTVKPELVFEIAFEGIQESPRHKSGIALRFPRMARWRTDKPAEEADTLENLKALLEVHNDSG